ncbi:hypothetical protein CYCD_11830 [Tenuifilaceae bacterium CYCD]|nr:hypothetical protein CYCD_11830 [Tenuifilaceae bacterium CYCD]
MLAINVIVAKPIKGESISKEEISEYAMNVFLFLKNPGIVTYKPSVSVSITGGKSVFPSDSLEAVYFIFLVFSIHTTLFKCNII